MAAWASLPPTTKPSQGLISSWLAFLMMYQQPFAGCKRHKEFADPLLNGVGELNSEGGTCVADAAQELLERYPDIKAFVCECHNLPPFGQAIQRRIGRPVFDILSLVGFRAAGFQ